MSGPGANNEDFLYKNVKIDTNLNGNGSHAFQTGLKDKNEVEVEFDPFVNSIPITDTFHHLGHEGMVFIHSDRHSGITTSATLDILIRIPAGDPDRQVHMRFNYTAEVPTGSLDVDIILYKDTVVSADGTPEGIVSTNDAVVKTSGVLMFEGPTITDVGTLKEVFINTPLTPRLTLKSPLISFQKEK